MSAFPDPPTQWPRRRRWAGFVRGSAGGGAVPIPITARKGAQIHRDLVEFLYQLPGVVITPQPGEFTGAAQFSFAGGAQDSRPRSLFAEVTVQSETLLRLPANLGRELGRAGWVEAAGDIMRVRAARNATELQVVRRIIVAAYDLAIASMSTVTASAERSDGEYRRIGTLPAAAVATGAAAI